MIDKDEESSSKLSPADRTAKSAAIAALITAAVALFTALVPYVRSLVDTIWQTPGAAITDVSSDVMASSSKQCTITFNFGGAAYRIPPGEDLWLAVRSREGLWYPVTRLSSGTWSAPDTLTTTWANLPVTVEVILMNDAYDGSFIQYSSQQNASKDHLHQGLDSLPAGNKILTTDSLENLNNECAEAPGGRVPSFAPSPSPG